MKKLFKIISLLMSIIMMFSICACGDNVEESDPAPISRLDYTDSTKKFDFFGYSSLFDGTIKYDQNLTYSIGENLINKERIQEYYDAGMGFLFPQSRATAGTVFAESKAKVIMDMAHELGYDKSVVITDNYLYTPYNNAKSSFEDETDWTKITCIGTTYDWQFKDEKALDKYVKDRLIQYYDHPAFQGVFLPDEPHAKYLKVIGEVYKSLIRVQEELGIEEMYINANLLPYYPGLVDVYPEVEKSFHQSEEQRNHEAYRRYLDRFMKESGAKYLQADIYPLSTAEQSVYRNYILNMQLMAEVAKDYDAKIIIVTQTTAYGTTKIVTYEDLNYLLNMTVGFGAHNLGYFTYYTHEFDGTNVFNDNGSMVTSFGDKTPIYYNVQSLNASLQKLAPTILNFNYKTSRLYYGDEQSYQSNAMDIADMYAGGKNFDEFTKLVDYTINKEVGIVTELYDAERDNYMYMAFNSTDPQRLGSQVYQTAKLTFSSEYTKAYVFFNGVYKDYELDENHCLTVKMSPGEAYYVMPYVE